LEYYDTYAEIRNRVPQKKMFKLTDADGSLLVLRPDMTLAAARMAATKLPDRNVKLCYFSNVWDYRLTGGLHGREIYQAGVEFLGVSNPFSDAQIIAFAVECLEETGVKDFIIDIGHVGFFKGLLEDCGLDGESAEKVRLSVNAKDAVETQEILKRSGAEKKAAEAISLLPTLFGGVDVLSRAEKLTDNRTALSALRHLKEVYSLLRSFGMEKYVSFDLGTVKDLSYYSGIVFTGLTKTVGSPVLSGGRYDTLASDFGKDIPAVGFAMGLKRILIALERQGNLKTIPPFDVILVAEKGAESLAYQKYQALTAEGKRVNLFCGDEESAKTLRKEGITILKVTKQGVQEI
jgi:ATP phosphoribosyltransferase regulatory subunit